MKKNFFKLISTLTTISMLSSCGDSSGGSSGPAPEPYVRVSTSAPVAGTTGVDALIPEIKVTLTDNVDPTSFVKEGTALANLIDNRAKLTNSDIVGLMNSTGTTLTLADYANLSLDKLLAESYQLVARYTNGSGNAVQGPVKITSYRFANEADTGLSSLEIYVKDVTVPFKFSSAELINSGYVNSKILKVEKISSTGVAGSETVEKMALGQVTVNGREIKFRPINYIDWESTYRITLIKDVPGQPATTENGVTTPAVTAIQGIKDLQGRTLPENFVAKFTTKALPKGAITNVTPIGIEANPLKKIIATTNMIVDMPSLNSATVTLTEISRMSNEPGAAESRRNIPVSYAFDPVQMQIQLTPTSDLGYLLEYEVEIKSGSSGIKGSLGSVPGIELYTEGATSYKWKFTTGEPKVISATPSSTIPITADGRTATIAVDFNFKVDLATVKSGLKLTDVTNQNVVVDYTPTLSGNSTVIITPTAPLKYGHKYTIEVNSNLKSKPLMDPSRGEQPPVALYVDYAKNFTTDTRQILSYSPSSQGVSETTEIILTTNFNISDAANLGYHVLVTQFVPNGFSAVQTTVALHPNNPRSIIIKASESYAFETVINVRVLANLPSADGAILGTEKTYSTTVRESKTLALSSYGPTGSTEDADEEVFATFGIPLEANTVKTGTRSDGAIRVRDCNGNELMGRVTMDSSRIYFSPSYAYKSFCTHTVSLDPDLRGPKNARLGTTSSWTFKTDGLRVTDINVTYAYSTLVDVESPFEIVFNKDLDYVFSSSVELRKSGSFSTIFGSLYRYGNKLTFSPYSDLEYGTTYYIKVKSDVEGYYGETMAGEYEVSFKTEDKKLNVYNYGPYGSGVATNAQPWVQFVESVSQINAAGIQIRGTVGGSSQTVYNDADDTFYMKPSLSTNSSYTIKFTWDYFSSASNSYLPTEKSWSITTASTSTGLSADGTDSQRMSIQGEQIQVPQDEKRVTIQNLTAPTRMDQAVFNESCRQERSCVGMLRPKTYTEYRIMTLLGKRKANLLQIVPSAGERARQ